MAPLGNQFTQNKQKLGIVFVQAFEIIHCERLTAQLHAIFQFSFADSYNRSVNIQFITDWQN